MIFDSERLRVKIKNNILSSIRKNTSNMLRVITTELGHVVEKMDGSKGKTTIERSIDGSAAKIDVHIPKDKVDQFITITDAVVKEVFRFENWSDMKK